MILHIDMDAFYASVEQADNPDLRGKCVIIGGTGNRSVVSAASYEARRYGVSSAMPIFMAREKCPQGLFLPVRMNRYKEISQEIMAVLKQYSPLVEQVSIDEAFMDVSGCEKLYGSPEEMAKKIKNSITQSFGLTCSVGVAPSKFLAKIASDLDKPDGLYVILTDEVQEFISNLPINKVPGVGAKAFERLTQMGIKKLGDINEFCPETIISRMGKYGRRLIDLAQGIDHSTVSPDGKSKSIGSEETLSVDTSDRELLKTYLLKQAEDVGQHLRLKNVKTRTITIKIKHYDFTQFTRSLTLEKPTRSSETIYKTSANLLEKYPLKKKARLIGVSASGLVPGETPKQMSLFNEEQKIDESWEKVDEVVDEITRKFGKSMIKKANLNIGTTKDLINKNDKNKKK